MIQILIVITVNSNKQIHSNRNMRKIIQKKQLSNQQPTEYPMFDQLTSIEFRVAERSMPRGVSQFTDGFKEDQSSHRLDRAVSSHELIRQVIQHSSDDPHIGNDNDYCLHHQSQPPFFPPDQLP